MYVVVCYDISNNRKRARLHELLLGYGTPVQKSVFECDLSASQLRSLRKRARPCVGRKGDSIRYYQMCGRCRHRTEEDGTSLGESDDGEDLVV